MTSVADRLKCEWCGLEFDRPNASGPAPRFCTQAHRQRAYESRRLERSVSEAARAIADSQRSLVAGLTTNVFRQFEESALAGLNANVIKQFQRAALPQLDVGMMAKLQKSAVAALDTNVFTQFEKSALAGLNASVISAFQGTMSGARTAEALSAIGQRFADALDPTLFDTLRESVLAAFDANERQRSGRISAESTRPDCEQRAAGLEESDARVVDALKSQAAGVVVVVLLVAYLMPAILNVLWAAAGGPVTATAFGLRAIDAMFSEYSVVRGAILLLGTIGGGASIASLLQRPRRGR